MYTTGGGGTPAMEPQTWSGTPVIMEFLCLEDGKEYGYLSEQDRRVLQAIQGVHQRHQGVQNSQTAQENEPFGIEFGCASEVFNSITSGQYKLEDPESLLPSLCSTPSLLSFQSESYLLDANGCLERPGTGDQEQFGLPQFGDVLMGSIRAGSRSDDRQASAGLYHSGSSATTPVSFSSPMPHGVVSASSPQRHQNINSSTQGPSQKCVVSSSSQKVQMTCFSPEVQQLITRQAPTTPLPVLPPQPGTNPYQAPARVSQPVVQNHIDISQLSLSKSGTYVNNVSQMNIPPPCSGVPYYSAPQPATGIQVHPSLAGHRPADYPVMGAPPQTGALPLGDLYQHADAPPTSVASSLSGPPPPQAGVAPPSLPGTPQHIHINHFTANLTYLPAMSAAATTNPQQSPSQTASSTSHHAGVATRQPVPFASFPLNYVAPFPHTTPSQPMFSAAPFPPPMMIYPPGHAVHFSMYAPSAEPATATTAGAGDVHKVMEYKNNVDITSSPPLVSVNKSFMENNEEERYMKSTLKTSSESQSKESPASILSQVELKAQEDQELAKLYESGRSKTTSESSNVTTTPRPYIEERNGHRPTPPPFPIPAYNPAPTVDGNSQENGQHQPEYAGNSKSWASLLFSGADPSVERINVDKPTARIPPFSSTTAEDTATSMGALNGLPAPAPQENQVQLGEYLKNYELHHTPATIMPRGLTNRSNWCFVNTILQALLACPTFYNLFKGLPSVIGLQRRGVKTSAPMLDAIVEFVNEYRPLEVFSKNQKKDRLGKRDEIHVDTTFEPNYVYTALMEASTWQRDEGRQEDAEEFLSHLLNVLDEEMRGLLQLTPSAELLARQIANPLAGEWEEISAKGMSCITRRVVDQSTTTRTPVQSLFSGISRSSVIAENCETSATLQPFFALQLDIQSPDVASLQDVLVNNFTSELLEGYRNPRSGQLASASKTLSLEELPQVLILHLKRMVYDGHAEQKVMKEIQFPVDLVIPRDILSTNCKTKYTLKQRQYKLFAVVYHKGREAIKGHYITDIYHTGYSSWLRCDDSQVTLASEEEVMTPTPHSTPYILFYRQRETMGAQQQDKGKVGGNAGGSNAAQ
jgi:ubiquitin carboxyl-terminal hydrolase 10